MAIDYSRVWKTMNELEMATSKICSAREILDSAIDKLQKHQYDNAETLMYAVDEFLQYYLKEFDEKFKDAWKETITKLKEEETDDCMPPWGHSDLEYLCKNKEDKVVKWRLPIEMDDVSGEYYITLPDDLQNAANIHEGDELEWIDQGDGSFLLKKIEKTLNHDEAIAEGWTMTDDGFWTPN